MTARRKKKPPAPKLPANYSGFKFGICTAVKSSGTVKVKVGGSIYTAQCPRDLTVAVGDAVVMARENGINWILNRYFVASNGNVDIGNTNEPSPPGSNVTGATTILPVHTRTLISAGWRGGDAVWQGSYASYGNATGCAFYGTRVAPLAGVTVVSATLTVERGDAGVSGPQQTTLWGVTQNSQPTGAPTLSGTSFTGPDFRIGQSGAFAVNTTLAQGLVDGTYGGVALFDPSGSPYVSYAGRSSYSGAWALTINWRR